MKAALKPGLLLYQKLLAAQFRDLPPPNIAMRPPLFWPVFSENSKIQIHDLKVSHLPPSKFAANNPGIPTFLNEEANTRLLLHFDTKLSAVVGSCRLPLMLVFYVQKANCHSYILIFPCLLVLF